MLDYGSTKEGKELIKFQETEQANFKALQYVLLPSANSTT
jgi:hypothetical protein